MLVNMMPHNGSLQIRVIDPTSNPAWNAFIQSHPDALIFHHPAWLNLLREQYRFRTEALCLLRNEHVVAGIPFCKIKKLSFREKWVCLPFSDYCGPLCSSPSDLEILMDAMRSRAAEESAQIEIRSEIKSTAGFIRHNAHWLHIADITQQPEDLLKAFKPRVRSPIRKAQKSRLINEIRRDQDAMDIFYRLHLKTRKRLGVPIQPRGYFMRFQKQLIGQNLGFISLTRNQEKYLSAAVFCGLNKMIVYKYGASDPAYLGLSPNHLLLWETMLYAKRQGFSRFNFGKTALSNKGLRNFKRGWNTTETELPYSYYPTASKGDFEVLLNEKLVMPVIKHSPKWVCRLAGEVLYKHFAV